MFSLGASPDALGRIDGLIHFSSDETMPMTVTSSRVMRPSFTISRTFGSTERIFFSESTASMTRVVGRKSQGVGGV